MFTYITYMELVVDILQEVTKKTVEDVQRLAAEAEETAA